MTEKIRLIVRGDDFGLSHDINRGIEKCVLEGIVTTVSLMTCATEAHPPVPSGREWALGLGGGAEEALGICRTHPDFDVGAHITLDRLKPVLPGQEVPSLVDKNGYMWGWGARQSDNREFLRHHPRLDEIEKEERAQIEKILNADVDLTYVDMHNSRAKATPQILEIYKKLAREYRIPMSSRVGEKWVSPRSLDRLPSREKLPALIRILEDLQPGLWLLQTHIAWPTEEMKQIEWWAGGDESMATDSEAAMEAMTSPQVKEIIQKRGIELTGYRTIRDEFREEGAFE